MYRTGVTQVQMNCLADAMGHDPATARNHYYRIDTEKQHMEIHDVMRSALAAPALPPAATEVATSDSPAQLPTPDDVAAAASLASAAACT